VSPSPLRLCVLTNLHALARVTRPGVELTVLRHERPAGLAAQVRVIRNMLRCDYVVINCSAVDLFYYCALKLLLPFSRVRIVSMDTVLPVPHTENFGKRAALWTKKLFFRTVHLFIEYFRDTRGYEIHYGIPRERFRYVPFKVNRYEQVLRTSTRDDGYIFCGGNTRRDFQTLLEAVRGLPYAVRIVTMPEHVISGHGSSLDERRLPSNVQVVRHDGGDSFLDHIAAARMVVLPIKRENISASGIGVYLASMALGKCVVISAGPAVNGVVPEGAALIVPPEDPDALRASIGRAYTDEALRTRVAAAGQQYAQALGGEDRLCESVLDVLLDDSRTRRG
jgi:glycosyltransferase involved in cell wall biosynthesis